MCSRFLVLFLVSLLPGLFLGCGASTQTPAPVQTPAPAPPPVSAPAPVQTPPSAPPPVEEKVEVEFDRFKNRTHVSFPPTTRQFVTRANTQLTPVWDAFFDGQTPSTMPDMMKLTFWKTNKTWEYLRCHSLAMLADGSPVQLPPTQHDGDVERGYVVERIRVTVNLATARKLSESRLVEFKICNTEGRFSEGDLQGLRGVLKVLTPR